MATEHDQDLIQAGHVLRRLLAPEWDRRHASRLQEMPGCARYCPTPSALHCVATCLAMGASSSLDPNAQPSEPGFLQMGQGWMRHPGDRLQTWHPHTWITLPDGRAFDITADQFGHAEVLLTPTDQIHSLSTAQTAEWEEWKFSDDLPASILYAQASKTRANALGQRNIARAFTRAIGKNNQWSAWCQALRTLCPTP